MTMFTANELVHHLIDIQYKSQANACTSPQAIDGNRFNAELMVKAMRRMSLEECYRTCNTVRKVFSNCEYTPKEVEHVTAMFNSLANDERILAMVNYEPMKLVSLLPTLIRLFHKPQILNSKQKSITCHDMASKFIQWSTNYTFPDFNCATNRALQLMLEHGCVYWLGRAKDHLAVLVFDFQAMENCSEFQCSDLETLHTYAMQWGTTHLTVPGAAERIHMVMDLRGISVTNIPIRVVQSCIANSEWKWPMRGDHTFIIHDSWLIGTVWKAIKGSMEPETQKRVKMIKYPSSSRHTPNKSALPPDLLDYIDSSVLWDHMGGIRTPPEKFFPFPFRCSGTRDDHIESWLHPVALLDVPGLVGDVMVASYSEEMKEYLCKAYPHLL